MATDSLKPGSEGDSSDESWLESASSHIRRAYALAVERAQAEQEVAKQPSENGVEPLHPELMALLLARRGFWRMSPQDELRLFDVEDHQGKLEVSPSAMGPSGVRETLVMWGVLGIWGGGRRDSPWIESSYRGLAQQMRLSWYGELGGELHRSLEILKDTSYRFVFEEEDRQRGRFFSLIDDLIWDWQGSDHSPQRCFRLKLGDVVYESLIENRKALRPYDHTVVIRLGPQRDLARRFWFWLEATGTRNSFDPASGLESFERIINTEMAGTLGVNVPLHKLALYLQRAGRAIVAADPRYRSLEVVPRDVSGLRRGDPKKKIRVVRARVTRAR